MTLLPLMHNSFATNCIHNLLNWWNNYGNEFVGQKVIMNVKHNLTSPLLQREYANTSQLSGCSRDAIPYLEITPLYKEAKDGLLFVNCNPSGTDYSYYKKKNSNPSNDIFYYDKPGNTYFDAVMGFAEAIYGVGFDNFAMIDAFPIVMQNQAVVKKAFYDAYINKKDRLKPNAMVSLII